MGWCSEHAVVVIIDDLTACVLSLMLGTRSLPTQTAPLKMLGSGAGQENAEGGCNGGSSSVASVEA
jgi:hypothetical protein